MLMLLNASRIVAGDMPLIEDATLNARAQIRAEVLCSTKQFSHAGWQASFAGLEYKWAGENLAKGFADATSTHQALMSSPTHRANILKKEYKEIGIGEACGIEVEMFKG